jgi:hypothetical protein
MATCKVGHDPFKADSVMRCLDCEKVQAERLATLESILALLDAANLGHGVGCPAVYIDPKPCTCGLDELDMALGALDAGDFESNGNQHNTEQNAE